MVAWYGAALLALAVRLGPGLAKPQPEPFRQCTAKVLACVQWSTSDTISYLVLPILVSCLIMSFVALVLMVREGSRAMARERVRGDRVECAGQGSRCREWSGWQGCWSTR